MAKPPRQRIDYRVGVVAREAVLDDMRETRRLNQWADGDNRGLQVAYGDLGLLHDIAARLGWKQRGWRTTKRVLDGLTRHASLGESSLFEPWTFRCVRGKARLFVLKPQHAYDGPLREDA